MTRKHTSDRTSLIVIVLTLVIAIPLATLGATTTASHAPIPTEAAAPNAAMATMPLALPGGELTWRVTEHQTGTESDTATVFEPGFVYALDDPFLLLFDDGSPLERLQVDRALTLEEPIEGHPVAMMADTPIPYVTIAIGPPTGTGDPITTPFQVEAGEYELSLWLVDTSEQVPEAVSQRLASQVNPILVLVRSGEIDIPATSDGAEARHLAANDWAAIAPDTRMQAIQGMEPPVLLFGTLDQPKLAGAQPSGPTTGSGSSAPQGSRASGGQPQPIVVMSTETPIIDPTDAPMVEPTVRPCHIDNQGECGPAPMPETTIPSGSGTSGESGSFEPGLEVENNPPVVATEASDTGGSFEPGLETGNNPPILLPTQASGSNGAFESAPMVDLPIFSTGSAADAPNDPIAVSQVELTCIAFIADADGDGLVDACETEVGSDPNKPDSDGDGLSDGDEVNKHKSDPTLFDTDGDKLTDFDEVTIHKSSPTSADSDGDDLSDGNEVNQYNTDPANPDSDGDGLDDGADLGGGTDPLNADFDGDGLLDGDEVHVYGTSPKEADGDGDGLTDGEEVLNHGTNPFVFDMDGDCMSDGLDIASGTSPFIYDTDGDGASDAFDESPLDPNDDSETTFAACS